MTLTHFIPRAVCRVRTISVSKLDFFHYLLVSYIDSDDVSGTVINVYDQEVGYQICFMLNLFTLPVAGGPGFFFFILLSLGAISFPSSQNCFNVSQAIIT